MPYRWLSKTNEPDVLRRRPPPKSFASVCHHSCMACAYLCLPRKQNPVRSIPTFTVTDLGGFPHDGVMCAVCSTEGAHNVVDRQFFFKLLTQSYSEEEAKRDALVVHQRSCTCHLGRVVRSLSKKVAPVFPLFPYGHFGPTTNDAKDKRKRKHEPVIYRLLSDRLWKRNPFSS
ncbi:unnamed protein product, partial [Ectocarpus fasciculatus]